MARQGNSPASQIVTKIAPGAFGTRFSVAILSCMQGALSMQLWEGVLVSLFPGIVITQTKYLVNWLVSQAAWESSNGLYK